MPLYLFATNQALPPGATDRLVVKHPGTAEQALNLARQQGYADPSVGFMAHTIGVSGAGDNTIAVLCYHSVPQPEISREHVSAGGGAPVGMPEGQQGRNRPSSEVDMRSGFQELGDDALPVKQDNMFGDTNDGTYEDVYVNGQVVPRGRV